MTKAKLLLTFTYLMCGVGAQAAIISVQSPNSAIHIGEPFSINVAIVDAVDLYAFQFDLGFATGVLSANAVSERPFLASGGVTLFIAGTINNSAGTLLGTANSLTGPVAGVSGNGVLANVQFTGLSVGTSTLSISNVILLNSSLADIPVIAVNGSVTVTDIPEPATTLPVTAGLLALLAWQARRRAAGP